MNKQEILAALKAGTLVRWVPKSILYNKVVGENSRRLLVGNRKLSSQEEREVSLTLQDLVNDKLVREVEERSTGITFYRLRKGNHDTTND